MKLFNRFDEQNRFCGFYVVQAESGPQENSHGMSYLGIRRIFETMGERMGLDDPNTPVELRENLTPKDLLY